MQNQAVDGSILSPSHELQREALVISEDFETPFSLGDMARDVRVIEDLAEDHHVDESELFLLNLRAPRAVQVASNWLERGASRVHYWATLENWQLIGELMDESRTLQVVGVSYEDQWIRLEIATNTEQAIQQTSFLTGLNVMSIATRKEATRQPEPHLTEPTLRGILVSKLVPLAKPLKRFIPHRLVIILYKILEKLR